MESYLPNPERVEVMKEVLAYIESNHLIEALQWLNLQVVNTQQRTDAREAIKQVLSITKD